MSCGKQRHDARALDGLRQLALVPGADAGAFGRQNFHMKIHIAAQEASIFVINVFHAVGAEETFFFFFWLIVIHIYLVIASASRSNRAPGE